ncbi:MAG: TonB-dependent receptor [Flavobacteriia bacterium]
MKCFFVLCLVFSVSASFYGQQVTVEVFDSIRGMPLVDATVYCVEYDQTVLTNKDGRSVFALNKHNSLTIKVVSLGYRSAFFTVNAGQNSVTVNLMPVHLDMHEVTVSSGALIQSNKNPFHIESQKMSSLGVIANLTLGEALAKIPGVYNAALGNGISKPVIRGMQGMRVITLLNGLRLEGQQWGGDHGIGITSLGVSAVEVIKGPASLLYGADALGGVVYLVDAPFAASNARSLEVQSEGFSNTLGGRAQFIYKESYRKFRWFVASTYANHADFQLPSGKFAKNARFNDLGAKINMSYTGKNSLYALRYTTSHSVAGIPGHTHDTLATPMTFQVEERARTYELPAQFFQNHLLQATANFYRDRYDFLVMYGATVNRLIEFDEKVTIPSLSMNLVNHLAQLKWQIKWNKSTKITAGLQSMIQKNTNAENASDTLIPNAKSIDVGGYFNVNHERNRWNIQAGFRFDRRTLFGIDLPNQGVVNYNGLNGSIGAVRSSKRMVFRTALSTGFRAPHLTELFSNGYHHGALRYEVGDAKLSPEKAAQLDVTLEWNQAHSSFAINPFTSYIIDYIYLEPLGVLFDGIPGYRYVQNNEVLFSGLDLSYHVHPHFAHGLHWEVSLSYLYVSALGDSAVSMIPQPRMQNVFRYEFESVNKVRIKEVNVQSTLMGPQNQVAYLESPSKAYHVLDFSLVFVLGKSNQFSIKAGGRNILNATYIDHLSRLKNIQMPFPGRNFFLGLGYNFNGKLKNQSDEN